MSTALAWSVALNGLEGAMVEVEVADGGGLPRTVLVGLPDAALSQAKERVRAAVTGPRCHGQAAWSPSTCLPRIFPRPALITI